MGGQLLEGKRETLFLVDPTTLTIIGLDTDDGPDDHRLYDERVKLPLMESMIANIMAVGVRESITVVVEGQGDTKRALVVDGRQRVRHAREANKRLAEKGDPLLRVPVIAERGMDEKMQDTLAISLNDVRQDDPIMVKAAKAGRMKGRHHTVSEIALAFGVEPQTIGLWLSINGLCDVVKKAIGTNRITPTAGGALAGLTPDEQKEALRELLIEAEANGGKAPTIAAVKAHVKAKKSKSDEPAVVVPKKRALRRVIETGGDVLSADFISGVRFAIGDLSPTSIKGLTGIMKGKEA